MGKTHRFDKDQNVMVAELDAASEDLMRAELELGGTPQPGAKYYAITDHLGAVLDAIESQPGHPQADADAEREAIYNATQALGGQVGSEYGADDVS